MANSNETQHDTKVVQEAKSLNNILDFQDMHACLVLGFTWTNLGLRFIAQFIAHFPSFPSTVFISELCSME